MKKLVALLFVLGVTLCTAAKANAEALTVTVPFDFVVGGKTLPAATYSVRDSLPNDDRSLVFLGSGHAGVARAADFDSTITGTKLVFHRIGDEYFLRDVVTPTGTLHFAASRQEKQRAREAVAVVVGN